METRTCYKCGKEKVAIKQKNDDDSTIVKMVMMSYGKHKNQFFCKNCKEVE